MHELVLCSLPMWFVRSLTDGPRYCEHMRTQSIEMSYALMQGGGVEVAVEKADGKAAKRKAGPSLRQRLEKRLKSVKDPGPTHSRPSRGFVFIK
jgi:hypothetical protein